VWVLIENTKLPGWPQTFEQLCMFAINPPPPLLLLQGLGVSSVPHAGCRAGPREQQMGPSVFSGHGNNTQTKAVELHLDGSEAQPASPLHTGRGPPAAEQLRRRRGGRGAHPGGRGGAAQAERRLLGGAGGGGRRAPPAHQLHQELLPLGLGELRAHAELSGHRHHRGLHLIPRAGKHGGGGGGGRGRGGGVYRNAGFLPQSQHVHRTDAARRDVDSERRQNRLQRLLSSRTVSSWNLKPKEGDEVWVENNRGRRLVGTMAGGFLFLCPILMNYLWNCNCLFTGNVTSVRLRVEI